MKEILFLKKEKSKYNKLLSEIIEIMDKSSDFLTPEEQQKRLVYTVKRKLSDYVFFLDDLEVEYKVQQQKFEEENHKGFFGKIFKKEDTFDYEKDAEKRITEYKKKILYFLNRLEKCKDCKCASCTNDCQINHCKRCRMTEYVTNCNNEDMVVTTNEEIRTLYSGDDEFEMNLVHFLLVKTDDDDDSYNRFVLMIDLKNFENQQICKFIDSGNDFDLEGLDEDTLDDVFNKFDEMGVHI